MDRFLVETKIAADESGELSGLAWPFGTPDRVGDVIEKGAFSNVSLPLPMLFGHDMTDPVGAWAEAVEKEDGLHVKGSLLVNDLPRAREVHALIKAGAVRGLSIGFSPKKAAPRRGGGRTIKALELVEISLVTVPMHPDARVASAKSAIAALRIAEAINRAAAQIGRN